MKQRRRGAFLAALWWLVGCLCLGVLLLLLAPRQEGPVAKRPPKNNEGKEPKGYPTLVVCFKMNV